MSKLTQIVDTNTPGSYAFTQGFAYDNADRLEDESRIGSGVVGSAYNYLYQYTLDKDGNYAGYGAPGGFVNRFFYDSNDKFMGGSGFTVSYGSDQNGNPQEITTGGVQQAYTYDLENRLTKIVFSNGVTTNQFSYNGDGQRVQKIDSTGTTRYLYDGASIIAETNSAGAITVYDTPRIGFTTGIGTYYFPPDGVGNNSGIVDNSQVQTDWYWYFAYGQTTVYHQGFYTPYKFEGKHGYYADGDSGMVLLGPRYYLPTTHGFLTQDPKGQDAGLNMYLYADNDPLSKVDPTGLDDEDEIDKQIRLIFTTSFSAAGALAGGIGGGGIGSAGGPVAIGLAVEGAIQGAGIGAGIGAAAGEGAVRLRRWFNYVFSSGGSSGSDTGSSGETAPINPLRQQGLPVRVGKFRFIPRKTWSSGQPLDWDPVQKGYVDTFMNVWRRGPAHHFPDDSFEWDVQLKNPSLFGGPSYVTVSRDGVAVYSGK